MAEICFLNTGLITSAGSASGVIGVIAHETGHIAAGHILKLKEKMRNLSNNQFYTSLLGIGVLLAGTKSRLFLVRILLKLHKVFLLLDQIYQEGHFLLLAELMNLLLTL